MAILSFPWLIIQILHLKMLTMNSCHLPAHKQTQGVILDLSTSQLHLALLKETIENSKTIVLSMLLKFLVCVLFNIISECTI